jgi:SAM-dependent methyltransferase
MGCGTGELTLGLARLGCGHVTGVDFVPRHIAAAETNAAQSGLSTSVQFVCADMSQWMPPQKFDVLCSINAFEHIDHPRQFLQKMADFVTPEGIAVLDFGPLFHSPFGDHMSEFFRIQIPWRGVLFSERAMLRVRREFYRPTDAAQRYQDIVGGLNLMRYSQFLADVRAAGWQLRYLATNPQLQHVPVIGTLSNIITRAPVIKDYFVFRVSAILCRNA